MVEGHTENGQLIIALTGKLDTVSAGETENEIMALLEEHPDTAPVLDCDGLEYVTSIGLRLFLRLRQQLGSLTLVNVHPPVYAVMEMTGLTEVMTVYRPFRTVSVRGCEVIGEGANGKVYRLGPDEVIKTWRDEDALQEIRLEQEKARLALVNDVPTAIAFDVVRVKEGGYGTVFELLDTDSFAALIARGEMSLKEAAQRTIGLMRQIHLKSAVSPILPDMKEQAACWVMSLQGYLKGDAFEKLMGLINALPEDKHLLHGDLHVKNIMLYRGEALLIDMDTLCTGNAVFELASMYNVYVGYGLANPAEQEKFLGVPYADCLALWQRCLEIYAGAKAAQALENKAAVVGLTHIMNSLARKEHTDAPLFGKCLEALQARLADTDTLEVTQ